MPRENRIISFDYPEVYQAVYSLCTQKQLKKPPAGTVKRVYQNEEDTSYIKMEIQLRNEETVEEVEYQRDFFAAALMLFCRGCGIPLPKSAKKSVSIKDDDVMLRVSI